MPAAETALSGLKIVDFSRFLPAAYASWVAADMGADVIRIEHPRELAKAEAVFGKEADPQAAARRRARPTYHRNKRSLKINPGAAAARPVLEKLIAEADVLVEDYRPGVMAAMGYGFNAMQALNPRLIYLSVSFAGQTGPYADRAGHDPLALSLAGALGRLNGQPVPSLPGLQVADVLSGMSAATALLIALQARERRGTGEHIDVAMSDAAMQLLLVSMGRHDNLDDLPRLGAWHPKGGVWLCSDGQYLCTTDMETACWRRFCDAVGKPEFAALQHDFAAHPRMHAELTALFLTRTRDEWFAVLEGAETQAMPVYTPAETLAHPHNRARGMVQEVAIEGQAETVLQLNLPFKFSETPSVAPSPAQAAGAHTAAILAELGFDEAKLAAAGAFSTERGG